MRDLTNYCIFQSTSIKEALKQMDKAASKILFVVKKDNKLIGSLSDGDIRRAILKGVNLTEKVNSIMNNNPTFVDENYDIENVKKILLEKKFEAIPIVNCNKEVVDTLFWNKVFNDKPIRKYPKINIPVVIMAGGRGTRLDPFTRILPKALIPIGEKPIIEIIMENFAKFGISDFYISINHKAKMIKSYFEDFESKYNIYFIDEEKPLGTAGSLKFLQDKIGTSFFVSNCDVIINDDYTKIYDFHKKSNAQLTLVASMQHYVIPYGVCKIKRGGQLKKIYERPEYDFLINTGMYLLESSVPKWIPANEFYNITDLIQKLQKQNQKIVVYPVSEKSWIDVGQWEGFKATVRTFNML